MASIDVTSWLPNLLGPVDFLINGITKSVPKRLKLNFIGNVSIVDNAASDRTDITLDASQTLVLDNSSTGTLNDVVTTSDDTPAGSLRMAGVSPTINGLASGTTNRELFVWATGGDVVLANEAAASTAANRIVTGTGANVTVKNGSVALLKYDATSSRWRVSSIGASAGGGGGSTATEQAWTPTAAPGTEEHAQLTEFDHDGSPSAQDALTIEIPDGYSTDHVITVQCTGPDDQYFRRTWRASWMRDGTRYSEKDAPNSSADGSANTAGYDSAFARSGANAVLTVTGQGRWSVLLSRLRTANGANPIVDSVTPGTGEPAGGTAVTIAGARFAVGCTVLFDASAPTSLVRVDANTLTCNTPAHAAGLVTVKVTNPDTKFGQKANAFNYVDPSYDPSTDTLNAWWRATYAGSPWEGQSSLGASGSRNLTEATNAPGTFGIGSYNAADFDGANDQLNYAGTGDDLYNAASFGIAILYRADTLPASYSGTVAGALNDPNLLCDVGAYLAIAINSTGPKIAIEDGSYEGHQRNDGNTPGTWYLLMVSLGAGALKSCLNGGDWTTTNLVGSGSIGNVATAIKVGTNYAGNAFFDGQIAEIIIRDAAWTDGDRASLVSYVNARYGLSL